MSVTSELELQAPTEIAVRAEADRIFEHAAFRQSDRCSRLLRYLVEISLKNPSTPIKERTIGHDVFGRPPGYDTSADPVVRNVASETRRRLRQYEHDFGPDRPIRIGLPPGQYMLTFGFRTADIDRPTETETTGNSKTSADEIPPQSLWPWGLCILLLLLLPVATWVGYRKANHTPRIITTQPNYFWDFFLDGRSRVIVSLAMPKVKENQPLSFSGREYASTLAYGNIAGMLVSRRQPYRMRPHERTSIDDMRDTPTILVASLDTPMIDQLLAPLHFYSGVDHDHEEIWILDRSNPKARWTAPLSWPTATNQVGYAIVARLKNSVTGGDVIIVSGQSPLGTLVASDYITNPRYIQMLNQVFRRPDANVEIILKLHSIQGAGVSPEMVSSFSW